MPRVFICTSHVFIHYTCFWRVLHAYDSVSEVSQGNPAELNQKEKNKEGDESSLVRWRDSAHGHNRSPCARKDQGRCCEGRNISVLVKSQENKCTMYSSLFALHPRYMKCL